VQGTHTKVNRTLIVRSFRAFGAVLSRVFVVITQQRDPRTAPPAFVDSRIAREVAFFRSHKKAWRVSERIRDAVDTQRYRRRSALSHALKDPVDVFVDRCADADEGWHLDDVGLTAAVVV